MFQTAKLALSQLKPKVKAQTNKQTIKQMRKKWMFETAKLALSQLKPKVPKENTQTNKQTIKHMRKKWMFETAKLALSQLKPKVIGQPQTNKSANNQTNKKKVDV